MHRRTQHLNRLIATVFLGAFCANAAQAKESFVRTFLAEHCTGCHGADTQEAHLRLDQVAANVSDPAILDTWVKVYDKVRSGQMPPESEAQPAAADKSRFLEALGKALHQASLEQQQKQGRVVLRRLNRSEYQNTLADLIGLRVPVDDLLPEDGAVDGFDNVAIALDVSPAHMARYVKASEVALEAAMRRSRNDAIEMRQLAAPWVMAKRKEAIGKSYTIDGNAAVLSTSRGFGFQAEPPRVAGTYRVTVRAAAVNTDRPLCLLVYRLDEFRFPIVYARWEVRPGAPRDFELTTFLDSRMTLSLKYEDGPTEESLKKLLAERSLEEAKLPGIRVEWIETVGPEGRSWPPESHRALFGDLVPFYPLGTIEGLKRGKPLGDLDKTHGDATWRAYSATPKEDLAAVLRRFASRAFRRPTSLAEVEATIALAQARLDEGGTFAEAAKVGFQAILCDPRFLYLLESPGELDDYAIASRLSYFLWSSMPDDELLALADNGSLKQPAVLRAQVERMLDDPRGSAFRTNFAGQWLDLRRLDETVPDGTLYPEYDAGLRWAMEQETTLFFGEVLAENLSLLNFIDSDFLYLNDRLARHYGIDGVEGPWMRKVPNPEGSHRGGLLTQASVMKVTAAGTVTSPVLRGKFVLERILGTPPSPPPPGISAIEPDIRGATTVREQLAKHKASAECASCHKSLDPPGMALECFDVIGGYRTYYRATVDRKRGRASTTAGGRVWVGPDVEAGDVLPDGRRFSGIDDYKRLLLDDREQITRALAEKVVTYATGGSMQFADREAIEAIVDKVRAADYSFRELIHQVVQSRLFRTK